MNVEVIDGEKVGEGHAEGLHLPLKAEHGDERAIMVRHGVKLVTVIEVIALERGCGVEELVIIREGEALPIDIETNIGPDYPCHRRHHVHYKTEVEMEVFYNGDGKRKPFKRHATVEDVLAWSVATFGIDPAMATEFELALHGQTAELPGTEHVGHLAGRHMELALDLVRGAFVNGCAW
jgi:hypothetical protein